MYNEQGGKKTPRDRRKKEKKRGRKTHVVVVDVIGSSDAILVGSLER